MEEADTIVQEVTDLLFSKGCTINRPAMLELGIYIVGREKLALDKLMSSLNESAPKD